MGFLIQQHVKAVTAVRGSVVGT